MLHPKVRVQFADLKNRLYEDYRRKITPTYFSPFEGYRLPSEQVRLLARGTTKAGPFQSAHNYGLAVDFVPQVRGGWHWGEAHDWDHLEQVAILCGLKRPIPWDRPHIQHPLWDEVSRHLV